jgi:hexose kinase, 1-phosphofructokinase family
MIITVTLNPSLDKVIFVDKLNRNQNNRSKGMMYDIGGKATHVSVVLSSMNIENVATGFLAGRNGRHVQDLLEKKNVRCDYVWQDGFETRETYIVVPQAEEGSYMITERGFTVTEESIEKLKNKLRDLIQKDDIVVFSGGGPNGIDAKVYGDIISVVKERQGILIVDSSGEFLVEGVKAKPYLIKPNELEFRDIIGFTPSSDEELIREAKKLNEDGIEIIALSLGRRGSIVSTKDRAIRVYPPKVKEVNDTGCGDVFLGGVVAMISQGKNVEDIFRFATAISASKATMQGTSDFSLEQTNQLMKGVVINDV